jgi:hypothetical protein
VRGIVKDVQITTVDGVLAPGGKLMEIVPLDDQLRIEVRIDQRDIAYVRPGLVTSIKFSAYDYSTLPVGEHIAIYRNNVHVGDAAVTGNSWSFTDSGLTDAAYSYVARVEDAASNQGAASTPYAITVDTATASVTETAAITAISTDTGASASDFITSDTSLTVSGTNTALSAGNRIQVSADGGTTWGNVTVTGTTWTFVDAVTHPTSFTYTARVVDLAGNAGQIDTQLVTIDTAAPNAPTIERTRGDHVHGTAEAVALVLVASGRGARRQRHRRQPGSLDL